MSEPNCFFLGTQIIFICAVPKILCSVNGALNLILDIFQLSSPNIQFIIDKKNILKNS